MKSRLPGGVPKDH